MRPSQRCCSRSVASVGLGKGKKAGKCWFARTCGFVLQSHNLHSSLLSLNTLPWLPPQGIGSPLRSGTTCDVHQISCARRSSAVALLQHVCKKPYGAVIGKAPRRYDCVLLIQQGWIRTLASRVLVGLRESAIEFPSDFVFFSFDVNIYLHSCLAPTVTFDGELIEHIIRVSTCTSHPFTSAFAYSLCCRGCRGVRSE